MAAGSTKAVFGAIAANVLIAISKFVAASFTGSSAMISEGIHSLVDSTNGLLLLLGIKRSKKAANQKHPFGYGLEIYFWSFIVSIVVFALGGGVALYEGFHHLSHPKAGGGNVLWNVGVLVAAILIEGSSLLYALKEFRKKNKGKGFIESLRRSKDAATFSVIIEETAAIIGLLIALVGVGLVYFTGNIIFDALASIGIGLLLSGVAAFMAYECKSLIVGESIAEDEFKKINALLEDQEYFLKHSSPKTLHFGPDSILLAVDVDFKNDLTVQQVEKKVEELEKSIKAINPKIDRIYIESRDLGAETSVS